MNNVNNNTHLEFNTMRAKQIAQAELEARGIYCLADLMRNHTVIDTLSAKSLALVCNNLKYTARKPASKAQIDISFNKLILDLQDKVNYRLAFFPKSERTI